MLDNWQRIEKVVEWSRVPSINAFAREIGLHRGENLYQIKKGNNGISRDLADHIIRKYPEISKAWLLAGEGTMLYEENITSRTEGMVPFYDKDVIEVISSEQIFNTTDFILLSSFKDCDFAAISYGEAMGVRIPHGSTVVLKQVTTDTICPGEDYLILSHPFVGIRKVRREPGSEVLRLQAHHSEVYDDFFMNIETIQKIYIIKGVIIKRTT